MHLIIVQFDGHGFIFLLGKKLGPRKA